MTLPRRGCEMRTRPRLLIALFASFVASILVWATFGSAYAFVLVVACACLFGPVAKSLGLSRRKRARVSITPPAGQQPTSPATDPAADMGDVVEERAAELPKVPEEASEQVSQELTREQPAPDAPKPDALARTTGEQLAGDIHALDAADTPQVPLMLADAQIQVEEDVQDAGDAEEPEGHDGPSFRWEELEHRLVGSLRLMGELRHIVEDIEGSDRPRCDAERHFAAGVRDTGVLEDEELPNRLILVELTRSGMLYIQGINAPMPYGSYLGLLSLEAHLNAMHLAARYYDDLSLVSTADLSRFATRLMRAVLDQAPVVDCADWSFLAMPWHTPFGRAEHGEWSTRHALSESLEGLALPWRLKAEFRANVQQGDIAIEFQATPGMAMAKHACLSEVGMVSTTRQMRAREASRYAALIGLLLVACSFDASKRIRRVWVQAIEDDPLHHRCLFSARIDRRTFSQLNLNSIGDPIATLASLGASMAEESGVLTGCRQLFHLGEATFCPPHRHDLLRLSERLLPASCALSLGARRVLDLSISEELPRELAADDICRNTHGTSAAASVRAILDVRDKTSDLTVWDAAERCARRIVDGTLPTDDLEALRKEMVEGDPISKALERAQMLIMRGDIPEAVDMLERELSSLDRDGYFRDTDAVAYRSFDSYAERVLYNRQTAADARTVALVPDAYLIAHVTLASLLIAGGSEDGHALERALAHSGRVLDMAPLNAPAHLLHATCLHMAGDTPQAQATLRAYLRHAFHPQGIGLAYLRLAEAAASEGDVECAYACYQMCLQAMPALMPQVFAEARALQEQGVIFPDDLNVREILSILERSDIPVAPTQMTYMALLDGACASVDAEVFPVARDLMAVIEVLTGDDVIHTIRESLEREPDA